MTPESPATGPREIGSDASYLAYQYGDSERFRIRTETHRLYSEHPERFLDWTLDHVDARAGMRLLDAGCGPGNYHPRLIRDGVSIVASDMSPGMVREAAARPIATVVADAQRLPFAPASFDRVMANHMLYHVPDIPAALAEFRRVLRPGGRAVFATNAVGNNRRMFELHHAAARECGFTVSAGVTSRFSLDSLAMVHEVFPSARVEVLRNAFIFPEAEPILRYYASFMVDMIDRPLPDDAHRPRLMAAMRGRVEELIAREGPLRIPKDAGCFVADV
jgi:SAM-dependent methyltransferase